MYCYISDEHQYSKDVTIFSHQHPQMVTNFQPHKQSEESISEIQKTFPDSVASKSFSLISYLSDIFIEVLPSSLSDILRDNFAWLGLSGFHNEKLFFKVHVLTLNQSYFSIQNFFLEFRKSSQYWLFFQPSFSRILIKMTFSKIENFNAKVIISLNSEFRVEIFCETFMMIFNFNKVL